MKLFSYIIFSSLFNQPRPLCTNCENFIQAQPILTDNNLNNTIYGKCLKFMRHNLITGNFTYEYADICRIMDNKCGETGKLYKEKE